MKNLEDFGVQELNTKEMNDVNGGIFGLFIAVFALGFLWGLGEILFDS